MPVEVVLSPPTRHAGIGENRGRFVGDKRARGRDRADLAWLHGQGNPTAAASRQR